MLQQQIILAKSGSTAGMLPSKGDKTPRQMDAEGQEQIGVFLPEIKSRNSAIIKVNTGV